jgi:hypothetical protein
MVLRFPNWSVKTLGTVIILHRFSNGYLVHIFQVGSTVAACSFSYKSCQWGSNVHCLSPHDTCEPLACEPLACEPLACEPLACEPLACEPLNTCLQCDNDTGCCPVRCRGWQWRGTGHRTTTTASSQLWPAVTRSATAGRSPGQSPSCAGEQPEVINIKADFTLNHAIVTD